MIRKEGSSEWFWKKDVFLTMIDKEKAKERMVQGKPRFGMT